MHPRDRDIVPSNIDAETVHWFKPELNTAKKQALKQNQKQWIQMMLRTATGGIIEECAVMDIINEAEWLESRLVRKFNSHQDSRRAAGSILGDKRSLTLGMTNVSNVLPEEMRAAITALELSHPVLAICDSKRFSLSTIIKIDAGFIRAIESKESFTIQLSPIASITKQKEAQPLGRGEIIVIFFWKYHTNHNSV